MRSTLRESVGRFLFILFVFKLMWEGPAQYCGKWLEGVGGIGGADIKIMGAAGMVIGLIPGISAMIIGLLGMIAFHLGRSLLLGKMQWKQSYPLIPFLSVGIISMYLLQMP